MDTLLSVEEKYLQVLEEIWYGEVPKAFRLLNEILAAEPDYARAHFQMGVLQHEHFRDLRTAGYHYQQCVALDPQFPDVYLPYLKLSTEMDMPKLAQSLGEQALKVPGTNRFMICRHMARTAEQKRQYGDAKQLMKEALRYAQEPDQEKEVLDQLKALNTKMKGSAPFIYRLEE
ncbi:hypothetical protein [Pedobacter sp. SYP-B3415]|uniref:hypothetical protein n=1 Tax=Pedobacter sp. SYP-B3415 TaxID=2496641 RepID=UPI00101B71A5|nr:hypothetical protein [Pedobacter sp. SYP-B3415]